MGTRATKPNARAFKDMRRNRFARSTAMIDFNLVPTQKETWENRLRRRALIRAENSVQPRCSVCEGLMFIGSKRYWCRHDYPDDGLVTFCTGFLHQRSRLFFLVHNS